MAYRSLASYFKTPADDFPSLVGGTKKGPNMTYNLNRGQFVENGPTLLAARDRQLRAAGQAYRLLNTRRLLETEREVPNLSAAA